MLDFYNNDNQPWGEVPPSYFDEALNYIQGNTVLDLGGAYGRFSLYLAQKKMDVTNVDISKKAIDSFNRKIDQLGLSAKGIVGDMTDFIFEKKYDNILCTTTLHLLDKPKALRLLENIKQHTIVSGINFISGFVSEHNRLFEKEEFTCNEFLASYLSWEILYYKKFMVNNINKQKVQYFILVAAKMHDLV